MSVLLSLYLSVRVERLCSDWTGFFLILCWKLVLKFVDIYHIVLKTKIPYVLLEHLHTFIYVLLVTR
jgi:hypothetical protein